MSPLHEQLRAHASWLFEDLGLTVTGDSYDPEAFGDSVVVLQSGSIKMRFIQDRGQISVELASPAELGKWWDVVFLLEAINGTAPRPTFDLDGVISLLRNFTDLVEALGPKWPQTKLELERRRQQRLQALRTAGPPNGRTKRAD